MLEMYKKITLIENLKYLLLFKNYENKYLLPRVQFISFTMIHVLTDKADRRFFNLDYKYTSNAS